jgi:hypothetical protein
VGGFLRFLVFFALLVAGFVLVALPLLMGPFLSGLARNTGVKADTVNVTVALFDPGLIAGRSRQVTVTATNVEISQVQAASLSLSLGGVDFFDRTFATVNGELADVHMTVGDSTVSASSASVAGPANAATVTTTFAPAQVAQLLTVMAAHNGLTLDQVAVTNAGARVTVRGVTADAQLSVKGGALLLGTPLGGNVVLLQPTRNDTWKLTDVWFTTDGMNMSATVDVAQIVRDLNGSSH